MKVRFSEQVAVGETDAVSAASATSSQPLARIGPSVEISTTVAHLLLLSVHRITKGLDEGGEMEILRLWVGSE